MNVGTDPSTVVIPRQPAQVAAVYVLRTVPMLLVLLVLVGFSEPGPTPVFGVFLLVVVVVYVLQYRRERRFALLLDANGVRECMPNGARLYWIGAKGLSLAWSDVTAIWVAERRWSTVVHIGAGGLTWTSTVVRRWKVLDDPEFDDKVAQIQLAWSRYANATWPPPPDEPGTVPRTRGGA